jgi:hypothetical protein
MLENAADDVMISEELNDDETSEIGFEDRSMGFPRYGPRVCFFE